MMNSCWSLNISSFAPKHWLFGHCHGCNPVELHPADPWVAARRSCFRTSPSLSLELVIRCVTPWETGSPWIPPALPHGCEMPNSRSYRMLFMDDENYAKDLTLNFCEVVGFLTILEGKVINRQNDHRGYHDPHQTGDDHALIVGRTCFDHGLHKYYLILAVLVCDF